MKEDGEMGFWIFMAVNCMLVPLLMIGIGYVFVKHPPETINGIYGYTTSMSRKNQQTWKFAHYYCGRLWWRVGWIMCLLTLIIILLIMGKEDDTVGWAAGIWVCLQCAAMVATVPVVEHALKRRFDRNGNVR